MQNEESWVPPAWWYKHKKPPNDDAYFENMCRVVLQAGLNWRVIDKKWPTIKKAFNDFSVNKVARFNSQDIDRLLKDEGIIRNKGKINAIIQNANELTAIKKQCGSFQKYLGSLDKTNNYDSVITELTKRFKWLGPSSVSLFLYTVGEPIKQSWDM
jgi:DNA-3-methyladenine glycosylase I